MANIWHGRKRELTIILRNRVAAYNFNNINNTSVTFLFDYLLVGLFCWVWFFFFVSSSGGTRLNLVERLVETADQLFEWIRSKVGYIISCLDSTEERKKEGSMADAPLSAQTRLDCCCTVDIHISAAKIFFGHRDCNLKNVSGPWRRCAKSINNSIWWLFLLCQFHADSYIFAEMNLDINRNYLK